MRSQSDGKIFKKSPFKKKPFLSKKSVDINSQKLKVDLIFFFIGHNQKWVWTIWSRDSRMDCVKGMNKWN